VGNGSYQLTVTDQNQCVLITEVLDIVANPSFEIGILEATPPGCRGAGDASISLGNIGGVEPLTYQWNTGDQGKFIDQLLPGVYISTITDATDCQFVTDSIFIYDPDSITVIFNAQDCAVVLHPTSTNGQMVSLPMIFLEYLKVSTRYR
jgi:hypothetical protein